MDWFKTIPMVVLLATLLVISFSGAVQAAPTIDLWNVSCVNGVETALFCNGFCSNPGAVLMNHTKVCATGCNNDTNSCETQYNMPTEFFIFSIAAFIAIAALFVIIGVKFKDDWGIIATLFFISAIILIVAAIGLMGSFFLASQAEVSNIINAVYLATGFIMFIFIGYIIMRWITAFAIKLMKDIDAKKRRM